MSAIRKVVTGTSLLFLGTAALAVQFQKAPGEIPILPAQLKLPIVEAPQIPAISPDIQAIEALDPLAAVQPAAPSLSQLPEAQLDRFPITVLAAGSSGPGQTGESVEGQSARSRHQFDG